MMADWRERYLKLADQHEREGSAHTEAERELTRLITRICVACSGLDPVLDPHLHRLRQAAKSGHTETLLRRADEFADSVVRASESRTRPGALATLLERGGASQRQVDEALNLWELVAADPGNASDRDLDRLAELLRSGRAPSPKKTESRGGLLSRLIGRDDAALASPNQRLLGMLDAVQWPEPLLEQIGAFRAELASDGAGDAWVRVVRQISDLAVRAFKQSQHDAQSAELFLIELNQRLEELDRHMLDEVQRRDDSRESGERLGQKMNIEVLTLTASVRKSASLPELQAGVISSVERMHSHVRHHLEEESARREVAEAEADQLRRQLRRLEQDTFDLRRQVAQTYREAMRDQLTGLPNRRAYDERMAQEYARWKRFSEPMALLVLDVDDFKRVNDKFGHKSGDKALVMIGRILSERLRETDLIARYGGEEFVVLLTGAERDDALRIAEAMRQGVLNGGLHANGQPVKITISCGLAIFAEGDSPETVFERADKALYQAKGQGKDRVVGD